MSPQSRELAGCAAVAGSPSAVAAGIAVGLCGMRLVAFWVATRERIVIVVAGRVS